MSVGNELRREVAHAHGLDTAAASLLHGETLEQVEASAATLARLINTRSHPEPEPPHDPLTQALINKAQRRRTLTALFTGRPQRDEQGRYAKAGSSFDGGARKNPPPPPESHDAWLGRTLRERSADRGASF